MRAVVALLCAGLAAPLAAQQRFAITGTVTDTAGAALPYCYVRLGGAQGSILCDREGRFRLSDATFGTNTIEVRRLGYVPARFTVDVEDTVLDVTIQLTPLPTQLQPVTVTATELNQSLAAEGFYERMRQREMGVGSGVFITPQEIEQLRPQHVTQLLSDRPAVKMGYTGELAIPWDRNGDCILNVFLDGIEVKNVYGTPENSIQGQRIGRGFGSRTGRVLPDRITGLGIDGLVGPEQVAAIEIYPSGPGVPQQFQVFGSCGAIVIWTKRGAPPAAAPVAGEPEWVGQLGYRADEVFPARRGRFGMPFVEVLVGRSAQAVLFDTGDMVGLSLATPRLDALNLPETGRWNRYDSNGRLVGTFRKLQAPFVLLFGQALMDHTVYEIADTALGGMVGPDQLPGTRFTLDYGAEKVAVSRSPLVSAPPGFTVLPLVQSARFPRLILAMGRLNGREVLIEFDTGKSRTTIDPALAAALGLARTDNGVRIDSLAIGPRVFPVASAKEAVLSGIDSDLTPPIQASVGSDILSQILLTVDYAGGQMLVRRQP